MHSIHVAEALAERGETDEAFAVLRDGRVALLRDVAILTRLWFLQKEMRVFPFLKSLHPDARWKELAAMPEGESAQEIIERLWPASHAAAVTE